MAAAAGEIRGRLAMGVIPTVAAVDIPAMLREFRERYPLVRVELRMGVSDTLTEQVRQGDLDIAFLGLPTNTKPQGVRARELARDQLVAVVAQGHHLARKPGIDLRQLASEIFVDFPAGTAGRLQSDHAFTAAGLDRDVAFEVTAVDLMARLVQQGLGVAMLPSAFIPQLTDVVTVPVTDAPTRIEHLIWSRLTPTPAATAFLTTLDIPWS